jgi:hypothetical protein
MIKIFSQRHIGTPLPKSQQSANDGPTRKHDGQLISQTIFELLNFRFGCSGEQRTDKIAMGSLPTIDGFAGRVPQKPFHQIDLRSDE